MEGIDLVMVVVEGFLGVGIEMLDEDGVDVGDV